MSFRFRTRIARGPDFGGPTHARAGDPSAEGGPPPRIPRRASAEMAAPILCHWADGVESAVPAPDLLEEEKQRRLDEEHELRMRLAAAEATEVEGVEAPVGEVPRSRRKDRP